MTNASQAPRPRNRRTPHLLRSAAPLALAACLAALLPPCLASARSAAAPRARAAVIGGTPVTPAQVPWQAYLMLSSPNATCGGVILDAGHVLTAAHCVVPDGTSTVRPASAIKVLAGFSDVAGYAPGRAPPPGAQVVGVAGVRVHPYYDPASHADDVAVLTLSGALDLAGPGAAAIPLAPAGSSPAPGAVLGFSGFGSQHDGSAPDGQLYAGSLSAIDDDACRSVLASNASASVLCATSPAQAPCHGDSGGPLTSPVGGPHLVGLVSFAPAGGCGTGPTGFADVAAPEVRAFVDGAPTIPMAPRLTAAALLYASVLPPVQGSPLRCGAGTWSGAPSVTYEFKADGTGQPLQDGSGDVLVPGAGSIGMDVVCVVHAANAGGVSTARTGTAPPIVADTVPPVSRIRAVRCRHRSCSVRLDAADPNSRGALTVEVRASQRYRAACRTGRRHRHAVRCTRTRTRAFAVRALGGVAYRAAASHLPRGRLRLVVTAVDAAGNRQRPPAIVRVRVR